MTVSFARDVVYHLIMLKLTILCLLLAGCAAGSTADLLSEPRESVPEPQRPAPAPVDAGGTDAGHVTCVLVRSIVGGDCVLDEYKCDDGSYRLDGRCYPPAWEVPWKNLPDPPSRP